MNYDITDNKMSSYTDIKTINTEQVRQSQCIGVFCQRNNLITREKVTFITELYLIVIFIHLRTDSKRHKCSIKYKVYD